MLRLVPTACSTVGEMVADELHHADLRPSRRLSAVAVDVAHDDVLGPEADGDRRALAAGGTGSAKPSCAPFTSTGRSDEQPAVEEVHLADEIGDEGGGRPAVDLVGRADLLDPALAHHHDPVGHGERLFLVVGHHDRGDAEPLLQVADLAAQPGAHPRVERRQRLVEQQQARRQRQRAGQRDALLLAAGELGRIFVGLVGEPDQRRAARARAGRSRPRGLPAETQAVADIVADGEVGKQRVGLEDDAEVALGHRQGGDVAAALLDAAGGLHVEARRSRAAAWSCRSPTARGRRRTRPRGCRDRHCRAR